MAARPRRRARHAQRTPTIPAVAAEHGMQARFLRGDLAVEDGPDPERPSHNVRRLRRADPLRALGLAAAELVAADRLRDDAERAAGARGGPTGAAVHVAPWNRWLYSEAVAAARQRLTDAFDEIEEELSSLHVLALRDVVIGWCGLRAFEDAHRLRHGSAAPLLRAALECLADLDARGRR